MGVFAVKSTASNKYELIMSTKGGVADEREEGEIVDEYEDIISSDEEFSMRQRIEELEAKNAELEKIANISGVYGSGSYDYMKKDVSSHQNDRYPLISIDISDDEEYPPAPSMSRISKRRKSLQHSCSRRKLIHCSSTSHRRRKKSSSPPPAPQFRPSDKFLLSIFHDRVTTHSSHSSKRKRKNKKSHSAKSSRRKSREYYVTDSDDDHNFDSYNVDVDDSYENFNNSDDRSYSLNREELRVALARSTHRNEQHVSLKDRLIRRKENTDTLNEKTTTEPQEIVEEESKPNSFEENAETEDKEEQELRIIALKSAVIRKHMVRKKRNENVAYSPSDFDKIYANITVSPSINNIEDTEACNSMEISPVPSPKMILSDDEGMDTKPVDMDIVNSDSDCELPSYEKWVPIEQIPLPNSMGMGGKLYVPTPLRYNLGEEQCVMPPEVRFESASASPGNLDSEVEEEELALRALLLAKMNSPKVNKIVQEEHPKVEKPQTPDPDISLEAEALRNFLINNMKKKPEPIHSSASVLKEAVRRLTARNSSPADGFTEIADTIKIEDKTAEETEIELGQAITDMARVKIGVEPNTIEPKKYVSRSASRDRGYVEPKEFVKNEILRCRGDMKNKQIVKRQVLRDRSDVEPAEIVKREILSGRGDGEPMEILKREILSSTGDEEPKQIVKKEVLKDRSDVQPKERLKGDNKGGIKSKEVVKGMVLKDVDGCRGSDVAELVNVGVESNVVLTEVRKISKEKAIETILPEKVSTMEVLERVEALAEDAHSNEFNGSEILVSDLLPSDCVSKEKEKSITHNKDVEAITLEEVQKENAVCESENICELQTNEHQENLSSTSTEPQSVMETIANSEGPQQQKSEDVSTLAVKKVKNETRLENTPKSIVGPITLSPSKQGEDIQSSKLSDVTQVSKSAVESATSMSGKSSKTTSAIETETVSVSFVVESTKPMPEADSNITFQSKTELITVSFEQTKISKSSVESTPTEITSNSVELKKIEEIGTKVVAQPPPVTALPSVIELKVEKPDKLTNKKSLPIPKKILPSTQTNPKTASKIPTQPSISRAKIVKPNKIINHQATDLKRKPVDAVKPPVPLKKLKTEDPSNRLITAAEMPQVKKLIIQLRASDTESEYSEMSADDYADDIGEDSPINSFINRSITIGNEYYDIASPMSLPMESPCDTPTRIASPVVNVTPHPQPIVEKSIVNDFFEAKLDQFLKNVRSKVADSVKKPVEDEVTTVTPAINTPVAVRHLPEASQQEYRRLINRMKMLERQKQAKNLKVIINTSAGPTALGDSRTGLTEGDKKTLVRKVLVKNASGNTVKSICDKKIVVHAKQVPQKPKIPERTTKSVVSPKKFTPSAPKSATTSLKAAVSPQKSATNPQNATSLSPPKVVPVQKPSKENLLDLYVNSYRKTGSSIISNLDKSIELVRVAKEAKMAKLKHENRLRELQKEMNEVERKLRQQQERITEIYPQVCSTHRMIESLKTRRGKINKAVTALGKSVIGPNYSVDNDQKTIISEKSKQLAAEIKFVNNMKLSDVEKWENENHRSSTDSATIVAPPKDLNICETIKSSVGIKNNLDSSSSLINKEPEGDSESPDTTTVVDMSVSEDAQEMEPNLNDTIAPEILSNKDDPNDSTNGHEEALETIEVDDKQEHDLINVGEAHHSEEEEEQVGGTKLQDYVSPLSHLRDERQINPNGIVCPYQLMGQCDDKDCKYMHLDE